MTPTQRLRHPEEVSLVDLHCFYQDTALALEVRELCRVLADTKRALAEVEGDLDSACEAADEAKERVEELQTELAQVKAELAKLKEKQIATGVIP